MGQQFYESSKVQVLLRREEKMETWHHQNRRDTWQRNGAGQKQACRYSKHGWLEEFLSSVVEAVVESVIVYLVE